MLPVSVFAFISAAVPFVAPDNLTSLWVNKYLCPYWDRGQFELRTCPFFAFLCDATFHYIAFFFSFSNNPFYTQFKIFVFIDFLLVTVSFVKLDDPSFGFSHRVVCLVPGFRREILPPSAVWIWFRMMTKYTLCGVKTQRGDRHLKSCLVMNYVSMFWCFPFLTMCYHSFTSSHKSHVRD